MSDVPMGLNGALRARYSNEALDAMSVDELGAAFRSTIREAESKNDAVQGRRNGLRIAAALEFPMLTHSEIEKIVDARLAS